MKNKKGIFFGVIGMLAGGLIAVGLQVHAAQVQNLAPSVPQVQYSVRSGAANDAADISEAKHSPETGTSVERPGGTEKKVAESDANIPGGGHADPTGNVDHQFEGVE